MKDIALLEEEEKEDLVERGFEFFRMRDLPANARAAHAHIHTAIEFIYLIEGSLVISIDGKQERLRKGDICMFRSRGLHNIYTEDDAVNRYFVLKVEPKLIHDISPKSMASRLAFRFSVCNPRGRFVWRSDELQNGEIRAAFDKLINELYYPGPFSDVAMKISAASVLLGVLKSGFTELDDPTPAMGKIYDSIIYINKHFDEDITAESVAEAMSMSYSYFSRTFKRATGVSFKEYLNITRTNRAEQLLVNTDMPVTDIALCCGYNNISYFISIYKQHKGKTPLSERK